jgi:hypothetical protein
MIRLLSLSLAATLSFAAGSMPAKLGVGLPVSQEIPKTATVEIVLLRAPGISDEGSRWEIAYEFRIADQATRWQAWKQRKLKTGSGERVGELIKEGVVKKTLRSQENRKVLFRIPLSPEIQERLRNHPRDWVKITPGKITPEDIKLSREQEMKAQAFLFYSVINIYDAKLKKTIMISYPQSWDFGSYPQARFEIKVEINSDGSYRVNSSLPTKTRSD